MSRSDGCDTCLMAVCITDFDSKADLKSEAVSEVSLYNYVLVTFDRLAVICLWHKSDC